jgi:hypothetical protein
MNKCNLKLILILCLYIFLCNGMLVAQTKFDSLHQYLESIKDGRFTSEIKIEKKHGFRTTDVDAWQAVPTFYWKSLTGYQAGTTKNGKTINSIKVWARYDIGINELMRGIICCIEYSNEDRSIDNDVLLLIYHNHAKTIVSQKSIFTIQGETPAIFTQSKGKTATDCLVKISNKLTFYCYSKFSKNNITDNAFGNYKVDDITGDVVQTDK